MEPQSISLLHQEPPRQDAGTSNTAANVDQPFDKFIRCKQEIMMTDYDRVVDLNRKLHKAGLVEQYVENTEWGPVSSFLADIGTNDKDILDDGCATGAIAERISQMYPVWRSYDGVDNCSEHVVQFNDRGLPRARARIGNAVFLTDQQDASKDIALFLFVLNNLDKEDNRLALRELRRVLRPEGQLFVGLNVYLDREQAFDYVNPDVREKTGAQPTGMFYPQKDSFLKELKEAGFEVESSKEIYRDNNPLIMLFVRARAQK
jgi:ubiquinone/menaquinone biosynthesis C-methylase UbiE